MKAHDLNFPQLIHQNLTKPQHVGKLMQYRDIKTKNPSQASQSPTATHELHTAPLQNYKGMKSACHATKALFSAAKYPSHSPTLCFSPHCMLTQVYPFFASGNSQASNTSTSNLVTNTAKRKENLIPFTLSHLKLAKR